MGAVWHGLAMVMAVGMVVVEGKTWFDWFGEDDVILCESICICPSDLMLAQQEGIDCVDKNISSIQDGLFISGIYPSIDFSRNSIKSLSANTFLQSTTLLSLDLSDNELEELPAGVFQPLQVLSSLNLRNNKIYTIDTEVFAGLQNLTVLDLSYNKITTLPMGVFEGLIHLEELNLGFNPIPKFNETLFDHTPALRTLDLSSLGIHTLHASFFAANLTKLEKLSLAYNQLTVIPSKALFSARSSLLHLDLSGNPITSLGAYSFYALSKLRSLVLDQMLKLKTIDAYAFGDLARLDTIVLRYLPKIESVDPKAFHSSRNGSDVQVKVQDFTFAFSSLATLPEDLLPWENLRYVSLQYNHWRCDCNMKWVKNSSLMQKVGGRMICSQPMRLRGFHLKNVDDKDLNCNPEEVPVKGAFGFLAVLMVAGLSASLATVSLLVYWRRGWVCHRPEGAYSRIHRDASTITITDEVEPSCSEA